MKTMTIESLGMKLNVSVPSTVDEFDLNAGGGITPKTGACLTEAVSNILYRSVLAQFRDLFLHGRKADPENNITAFDGFETTITAGMTSEEATPLMRKFSVDAKGEPEDWTETQGAYFKRALALIGKTAESFTTLAQSAINLIAFHASSTERKPTPLKKTPAVYLATADQLITAGTADKVAAVLSTKLGKTITADRESLAKGVAEFEAIRLAEERKKLAANMTALVQLQ